MVNTPPAKAPAAAAPVVPSRFLVDANGTFDLASVSAILSNSHGVATVVLDGGADVKLATAYPVAVKAWQAYLEDEPAAAPAPTA
jgi:hypothetical protein